MKYLFIYILFLSSNASAENIACENSLEKALMLIQSKKLTEVADNLEYGYKKIEVNNFKLVSLEQVECYTELLNSTRAFIKVSSSSKSIWSETELTSIKKVFESNTKHLWVLANQYRNTLLNYIKLNSKTCSLNKLKYGKVLLNSLINAHSDYFTSSQLEQNVKFEQMSSSCITSTSNGTKTVG